MSKRQKVIRFFGDGEWIEGGVRSSFEDADIVIMEGGSDWASYRYGHRPIKGARHNEAIDERQMNIIDKAVKMGKALWGHCRGLQGLTIKAGGYLVQHLNHPSRHEVVSMDGFKYDMNSCHHQLCVPYQLPDDEYEVISWTEQISPMHIIEGDVQLEFPENSLTREGKFKEPEIIHYPKINAMGQQGHIEWLPNKKAIEYHNFLLRERLKL